MNDHTHNKKISNDSIELHWVIQFLDEIVSIVGTWTFLRCIWDLKKNINKTNNRLVKFNLLKSTLPIKNIFLLISHRSFNISSSKKNGHSSFQVSSFGEVQLLIRQYNLYYCHYQLKHQNPRKQVIFYLLICREKNENH